MRWVFGDDQLREYVDPWGVPYVYIHNRDYVREYSVSQENGPHKISAGTSKKTATFHGFKHFSTCIKQDENDIDGMIHKRMIHYRTLLTTALEKF